MKRFLFLAAASMVLIGYQATDAQECTTCSTITPVTTYHAVQETHAVTKMVARTILEPVTTHETVTKIVPRTTYVETRVVTAPVCMVAASVCTVQRVAAPNWNCVGVGIRAYFNCSGQKRAARRAKRAMQRSTVVAMPPVTGC